MSGQPYIYQGEELGYYGVKNNGDEYVRTPIMWNKNGSGLAKTYLGSKYSGSMLIPAISVESQSSDEQSILSVYRKFGEARDSYYALSKGDCELCTYFESQAAICAYFRSFDTQKLLVIHNFSSATQRLKPGKGSYSQIVVSNGNVSYSNDTLTMGAYSSVVFIQ